MDVRCIDTPPSERRSKILKQTKAIQFCKKDMKAIQWRLLTTYLNNFSFLSTLVSE